MSSENSMNPVLSIAAEHLRVLAAIYKMQIRSSQLGTCPAVSSREKILVALQPSSFADTDCRVKKATMKKSKN